MRSSVTSPRESIAARLSGRGIEIGAGHWPFPTPATVDKVTYVSRLTPEEEQKLFPEVGDDVAFGAVEVVADLDVDGLSAFPPGSQDFVIASHVLEHLAAPIHALAEMLRVVKPGGAIILVLPDRRMTFDSERDPTPLEHLVREHNLQVRTVSDEHLLDFVVGTRTSMNPSPEDLEWHRRRSVHVHCWTYEEFWYLLTALQPALPVHYRIEAEYGPTAPGGTGIEFGFALRVGHGDRESLPWVELAIPPSAEASLRVGMDTATRRIVELQRELATLYDSRTWRFGRPFRSFAAGVRQARRR
jgi:SAM-dependent methyltransferase